MHRWYTAAAVLMGCILAGCGQPKVDLAYSTNPDDVIVQATSTGGLVPEAYVQSYIPGFRLYGDGRVVWSNWSDGQTSVQQANMTAEEMSVLVAWIAGKGFFGMKNLYIPKNPPTDLPNDCVRVNPMNEQKIVCEYYEGAPKKWWEIYGHLRRGADVTGYQPYQPMKGRVIGELITWGEPQDAVAWPESLTPRPADMPEGEWVEGEALDFLWQGRLEQGPWMIYEDGGEYYGLVLQVPGLMPEAPKSGG
jgi:hypothetical protein